MVPPVSSPHTPLAGFSGDAIILFRCGNKRGIRAISIHSPRDRACVPGSGPDLRPGPSGKQRTSQSPYMTHIPPALAGWAPVQVPGHGLCGGAALHRSHSLCEREGAAVRPQGRDAGGHCPDGLGARPHHCHGGLTDRPNLGPNLPKSLNPFPESSSPDQRMASRATQTGELQGPGLRAKLWGCEQENPNMVA